MGQLRYYSMTPNDKPEWLLRLQLDISIEYAQREMKDTQENWEELKGYTDELIHQMYARRDIHIRSEVHTELRTDEGKTVLHILRNRKIIQTYYIG